jgi:hypothetical protein
MVSLGDMTGMVGIFTLLLPLLGLDGAELAVGFAAG